MNPLVPACAALLLLPASAPGALVFGESGGFLTSITMTADIPFTVLPGVGITDNAQGYNLVFQNAYAADHPSGAPTVDSSYVAAVISGRSLPANRVSTGLSADAVEPDDLLFRFGQGAGFTSVAAGETLTILAGTITLDDPASLLFPDNLASGLRVFLTPNAGNFGLPQITDARDLVVTTVPEPSAALLLAAGGAALAWRRPRRRTGAGP